MSYQSEPIFEELVAFVSVVASNGFTAATRLSGARKATLSTRVASLERRLGVPLLVRTTRSIRLTEEGRAYFEHAQRSVAAARDAEAVVSSAKLKPNGLLRVTIAISIADMLFEEVVLAYLAKYPDVSVIMDTSVRTLDLVREGVDLAVRLGPLEDSNLTARRLGSSGGGYYANPRYLECRGVPQRPEDLSSHDTIAIPQGEGPIEWTFVTEKKKKISRVVVRPKLTVTNFELAVRAAAAGLGVVRAPQHYAQPYLTKRKLIPILIEWSPEGADVHAVAPPGGMLVPKTRAFVDMLVAWFKNKRLA
jgi:LysR family transcriptional regulator, regulator for bpeEF and oprC